MTGVGYPIEYNYLKYLPNLTFLPRKRLNLCHIGSDFIFSISKAGIVDIKTIYMYIVYLILKRLIMIFIFTMWPVP